MSEAPLLKAGPLNLVPFETHHLSEDYIGWLNDPDVVRFSEQRHRQHNLKSCRVFVASFASEPNLLWAIEVQDSGQHIGNITARIDLNNRIADIGILLGPPTSRGKGYGRYAWGAVLDYLCARQDLHKVTGGCLAANVAMVALMRATGMQSDGHRPDHYLLDNKPSSLLFFSKLGQWKELASDRTNF